jgi:hypothetical protein
VSQDELGYILELRRQIEALEERRKEAEAAVKSALEAGAQIQDGILRAYLKAYERRSVSWKQICERELGEEYCARVFNSTKPQKFADLVISA